MRYQVLYRGAPIATIGATADGGLGNECEFEPGAGWARDLVDRASDVARNLGYLKTVDEAGVARGAAVLQELEAFLAELTVIAPNGLLRSDIRVHLDSLRRFPGRVFVTTLPNTEPGGSADRPASRRPVNPLESGSQAAPMPNDR